MERALDDDDESGKRIDVSGRSILFFSVVYFSVENGGHKLTLTAGLLKSTSKTVKKNTVIKKYI
jgi:hypothetical protein